MMRQTWYVLEDGRAVDPAEVKMDARGRLVHPDGVVAMRGDVPWSRNVDVAAERARYATREMVPEKPARGYKTRKAD